MGGRGGGSRIGGGGVARKPGATNISSGDPTQRLNAIFTNGQSQLNGSVVHGSMSKVNPTIFADTVTALAQAVSVYPNIEGALGVIKTTSDRMDSNAMAWACVRTINLSPAYYQTGPNKTFKSEQEVYQDYESQVRSNWHPAGTTFADTAVHELGHVVDGMISEAMGSNWRQAGLTGWSGKAVRDAVAQYRQQNKGVSGTEKQITELISRYGASNRREAFAEAFAQYAALGDKAHPISVIIGKATIAKLGETAVADYINSIDSNYGIFNQ